MWHKNSQLNSNVLEGYCCFESTTWHMSVSKESNKKKKTFVSLHKDKKLKNTYNMVMPETGLALPLLKAGNYCTRKI